MTTPAAQPPTPTTPPTNHHHDEIVEHWWCPICNAAAHRTHRPGRPRIYCTNACRQRAYRYRRHHGLRTRATLDHPTEAALTPYGPRHSLRARHDLLAPLSDQRRRRITVCGALAKPARHTKLRHYDFHIDSDSSCRTCLRLVLPPGTTPPPTFRPTTLDDIINRPRTHTPDSPPSFDEPPNHHQH